jgi:hypothetical protein
MDGRVCESIVFIKDNIEIFFSVRGIMYACGVGLLVYFSTENTLLHSATER